MELNRIAPAGTGSSEKTLSTCMAKTLESLAERRRFMAEAAGLCPEHGEYSRGDAIETYGKCPKCWKREEARREAGQRLARFEEESGVPKRFRQYKLADFAPPTPVAEQVFSFVSLYAADFPKHYAAGRSIVMCGRTGTGKTMLGCAVARHIALEHGRSCRYTTAYHIVRDIKDTYGGIGSERDVVRGYIEPALLIVDEIGVQHGTDTEKLLLFEVLNGRYEAVQPTIVISNLEQQAIGECLGDRVMDRLRENGGAVLVFDWPGHRK